MNEAIDNANEAILSYKEKTVKSIQAIQSNILLTEKEKEDKIASLAKELISAKQKTADKLFDIARESAKETERQADKLASEYAATKKAKKDEIASLITT